MARFSFKIEMNTGPLVSDAPNIEITSLTPFPNRRAQSGVWYVRVNTRILLVGKAGSAFKKASVIVG